jgi:hypothetical protein
MSYSSEHRKMLPIMELAERFSIEDNPDPKALFDPNICGFNIWCTPDDNPGGCWIDIKMIAGAFSKPCCFVGQVIWKWAENQPLPEIIGLELETDAYELRDQHPDIFTNRKSYHNRTDDLDWCKKKINDLFEQAGLPTPSIFVSE